MTRHVFDHTRARTETRMARYAALDRSRRGAPAPQTEALRRAPRGLSGTARLLRFLRLARREG